MSNEDFFQLANLLIPTITAVVGVIGVSLRDWRGRRTDAGRRKLALADAKAQVEFISAWCAAHDALRESTGGLDPPAASRTEAALLVAAADLVAETELVLPERKPELTFSRLALLYPFRTTSGKIVRALFYAFCGLTVTSIGATITQTISPESERQNWIAYYLVAGTVSAPLAVVIRFLAVAVDGFAATAPGVSGSPARNVGSWLLLTYQMVGRPAAAVRLLYYLSILGVLGYITFYVTATVLDPARVWFLPLNLAATLVYGATVIGIRAWAVSLDQVARAAARGPTAADPAAAPDGSQPERVAGMSVGV